MERILKLILALLFVMLVSACIPGVQEAPDIFNVIFETNGGTSVGNLAVEEGKSFLEPTQPTKEGHTFNGWYSDSSLNNPYNFTYGVLGDTKLYAAWEVEQITMAFESDGATILTTIAFDYDTVVNEPLPPEKDYYTFSGWYEEIELTTLYDFESSVTKDITLHAAWDINQYTMSFVSNGGTGTLDIEQDYNTIITEPTEPTNSFGSFVAWYTNEGLTTEYDFNDPIDRDITLYAGWEYQTLTIYFVPSRDASLILTITEPLKEMLITELDALGYNFSEVIIEVSTSFEAAGMALVDGEADIAFLPSFTYAQYSIHNEIDVILTALRSGLNKDFTDAVDWNDGTATERTSSIMAPYYRGLIIAGPSSKGRELAAKVNAGIALTWADVNSANWCVRSSTSSSGFIYPSIWLMDHYDGRGIIDLYNFAQSDSYGTSIAYLAAETCDVATVYSDARMDYAYRWNESSYNGGFERTLSIWEETDVIGVTNPIYNDTISVSNTTVDADLAAALQIAFMNIADTPAGLEVFEIYYHEGYQIAEDSDYDYARIAETLIN